MTARWPFSSSVITVAKDCDLLFESRMCRGPNKSEQRPVLHRLLTWIIRGVRAGGVFVGMLAPCGGSNGIRGGVDATEVGWVGWGDGICAGRERPKNRFSVYDYNTCSQNSRTRATNPVDRNLRLWSEIEA